MHFPYITHINDVLPHVEGRDDFVHGVREGFQFIDYVVTMPDTFLDPWEEGIEHNERTARLMRFECRGIKFGLDGFLLARPFHKFFNIGEKAWTQCDVVDWSREFTVYDKLDGSMIHPIWIDGEMHFCTRMGITEVADDARAFADKSGINYKEFCERCDYLELTPLFEWCTSNPYKSIVLKHEEDHLVLTGIRHMPSGKYYSRPQMEFAVREYGIPLVGTWNGDWKGIGRFLDDTKQLVDAEGYVIDFDDDGEGGEKYKTKGEWYVAIHRAKDGIKFEKEVIRLIIERKVDDILPSLLEADRDRLERFHKDFWDGVLKTIVETDNKIHDILQGWSGESGPARDRWFAQNGASQFKEPLKALAFNLYHGKPGTDHIIHRLGLNLGSGTRVDRNRALFGGINWFDY